MTADAGMGMQTWEAESAAANKLAGRQQMRYQLCLEASVPMCSWRGWLRKRRPPGRRRMRRRRCHGRSRSSSGWQTMSPCSRSLPLGHSSCSLSLYHITMHSISRAETALKSGDCQERPLSTCHPKKRACSLSWTSMLCGLRAALGVIMVKRPALSPCRRPPSRICATSWPTRRSPCRTRSASSSRRAPAGASPSPVSQSAVGAVIPIPCCKEDALLPPLSWDDTSDLSSQLAHSVSLQLRSLQCLFACSCGALSAFL